MQAEHGGNDEGPGGLSVDAQIEADQRRVAELTKDGRVSRGDAVWQVRNENNAELVKENARASLPGSRDEPEASTPEQSRASSPEPEGAGRQSGPDYSYAPNGMARHRSDGLHHMPEGPGRPPEGPDQDRAAEQAGPEHGSDQPEPAQVRSEAGRESASYRDMMRASEARQIANRTHDHDHSRG